MKNCEYFQKVISDLHDDEIELSQEVKEHLERCSTCFDFYSLLESQSKFIRELSNVQKLTTEGNKKSILKKIWETKLTIPLPAAAIFLLFFGIFLLSGISQTQLQKADQKKLNNLNMQNIQLIKFSPQKAFISNN